jgi:hypothetical protein
MFVHRDNGTRPRLARQNAFLYRAILLRLP